jgi:hypothetical protein
MNLTKMISSVAIAGAIICGLATSALSQSFSGYPLVKLSISGTLYFTTNSSNIQSVPLKKYSYTTQTLIDLLNASSTATNKMQTVAGTNQIPKGSYFIWDPDSDNLYLTNQNGFFFPLQGSGYQFGYLTVDENNLIGTVKYSSTWVLDGKETDKTGIFFYFGDGEYQDSDNEIELYGIATLTWTYGNVSAGSQKASLSVSMSGNGNNDCYIDDFDAIPASFSASGSGTTASMPTDFQPFFYVY